VIGAGEGGGGRAWL